MQMRSQLEFAMGQLSYLQWGNLDNPKAEPVLLLHGLADHAGVWGRVGDRLASENAIVAPDLRGHGNSSKPATGYGFEDYIQDLNQLMDHLGWTSAHILGHSWAGKLAAIWATRQPERFRSLILVDPFFIGRIPAGFRFTFPLLYRVLPFLKMMGPFASFAEAEQQAQQLKQYRGWSALQQRVCADNLEQKPNGTWGSKFVPQARDEIFEAVLTTAGLTQAIALPTLFVKPKQGLNRTEWQLKPYRTYLPQLQIAEVPGNHWAFLVEPDAFEAAIAQWLQRYALR